MAESQSSNHFATSTLIEKLHGLDNYLSWKFAIKMMLTLENLWGCVDGSDADGGKDARALARICLSIQPSLYQLVRNCTTSKDAWKKLADAFEDKGLYRKVLLLRQLHRVEYHNFSCMSDYIEGVMKLVAQLSDIGKNIEDGEVAEILLSGLPEEYNVLVSGLETAGLTNTLTSEIVRTRLLQEDHRKSNIQTNNDTSTAYMIKKKNTKLLCSYCKRNGHVARRCFKRKREEAKANKEDHTLYAAAYSACTSEDFIIDSGATVHLAGNQELLHETKKKKCLISIANGEQLSSELIGKVPLNEKTCIDNVIFVPQLASNLLSVNQITEKDCIVVFDKQSCNIYYKNSCKITGNCFLSANKSNGLYRLKLQEQHIPKLGHSASLHSRQGLQSANAAVPAPMHLWHRRLAHLHRDGMYVLGGGDQCVGVVFQNKHDLPSSCVPCLTGKMSVTPVPRQGSGRATKPLELIHSDVCGPMQVSTWNGARFLLTFTDDCTRKSFGYLMKNKSEVSSHFIDFKNMVEKQTGLHIKILRSDCGTEYCNSNLSSFLKRHGIIHQTTVPYNPNQNGVSERLNLTILSKARAMLQESGLDDRYWGEAVMTAIYLKK